MAYAPMDGRPTEPQFQAASREFARRLRIGDRDIRVLVARNVPMDVWKSSIVDASYRIEAHRSFDGTTVDIDLVELPSKAHEVAVIEISRQLGTYALYHHRELMAGGGFVWVRDQNGQLTQRSPDSGLQPSVSSDGEDPITPQLIVEVSVHHQPTDQAQRFCRQYLESLPSVRAVLLIKIFERRVDRRFACFAVLYRRDANNNVMVDDVVSFGSAELDIAVQHEIERSRHVVNPPFCRDLPLVPLRTTHHFPVCEWAQETNTIHSNSK